ncbi:MAG: ABC transporter permease [Limisphaerales bacterium]
MTFLPIVQRELRVASRRSMTYWSRLSTAAATLFVSMVMLYSMGLMMPTHLLSAAMFQTLIWFVFIYALFVGARITADCVSVEKRDGTLGLLFLTDLKGYDVVLGKLAATSLPAFYGLVAGVPILAIPLLLGGVGLSEMGRATLVLLNTMFFSLAAGMLVSAVSRNERKAASGAIILIALVAGGVPLAGLAHLAYLQNHGAQLQNGAFGPSFLVAYLVPSPAFACFLAFDQFYAGATKAFWASVAITHVMAWICLGAASWIMPRVWQDRPATAATLRWRERFWRWTRGSLARRKAVRTRRLDRNPVYWLASRNPVKSGYIWFVLAAVAVGWCWGFRQLGRDWLNFGVAVGTTVALQTVVKYWLAGEACGPFAEELRTGTIELLLSTPLSVDEIVRGQWLVLKRQATWPMLLVLALDGLLIWGASAGSDFAREVRWRFGLAYLAGMVMFVADLFTLTWVGMWLGLSSTNVRKASGRAVLEVLILPWVLFYALVAAWSFAAFKLNWSYQPEFHVYLIVWFAVSILTDIFFWLWSRNRLRAEFRARAMQRYVPDATASIWYQLGKKVARWRYGPASPRPAPR